jgi:hypothetical protein
MFVPFLQHRLRVQAAAVVVSTLIIATLTPASTGQASNNNDSRQVLAYYYAWWDQDNFGRTLFQPGEAYNSDNASVIQRHVQEAQSAGIDGFVMSWYGNGDRTDNNLSHLLDIAQKSGFRATIDFETSKFYDVDDVIAQLSAFYNKRINHPAIVTYQGRPVIFFWRAGMYDNATWNGIRSQVDPDRTAVWIADGDDFNIVRGDAWDGISPYSIAWSASPTGQLASWAAKAQATAPQKLWIPPVSPGCNDSAARSMSCSRDRADGSYYQATWDGAFASNPSWAVIVNSFNEWLEATQIEPTVQYGDQYLQITRQNADQYHAAAQEPNQ